MNSTPLTPLQKAAITVKSLRDRVDGLERARSAPIAVIGMACRLPAHSNTPEALWEALKNGRIGSIEVPSARWDADEFYDPEPGVAGKMYVKKACFIDNVDEFDPLFFRISPREAVGIDPQQRLLLEVVHEALEDAGIPPPSLSGSLTGVFLGISTNDYSALLSKTAHGSGSNAVAGAGNAASVASGRISYTFGFQGPCFAVDTACSSSLVTAHLAVQSLRDGESNLALVAGVNLMLTPDISINFCQGRMLSPDGLCKTFDADADGYVRGEGCGVLVLKRLDDAIADGDRVLSVISGSAINQDGKSAGLTAPNGAAQVAVINRALANAGLQPDAIDFIEAHGTGTSLGDPIEIHAMKAVFDNRKGPLSVGSVKTNIGHTEAAAGVSGLIKAVLMLQNQTIPPHPSFKNFNPHIDPGDLNVEIAQSERACTLNHIGVSSFGFSGTNAHIIVSAAPENLPGAALSETTAAPQLLITAKSQAALETLIGRYRNLLEEPGVSFRDVCYSASIERARYKWWVAVDSAVELNNATPSDAPLPKVEPQMGNRVRLPKTPFERQRYWIETGGDAEPAATPEALPVANLPAMPAAGQHPLLGRKIILPFSNESRFENQLAANQIGLAFILEHRVSGQPVLPGTAMIEMALAANPQSAIKDMLFIAPVIVPESAPLLVQFILDTNDEFRIVSVDPETPQNAVLHVTGRYTARSNSPVQVDVPDETGTTIVEVDDFYASLAGHGVDYGPTFRRLNTIRRLDGAASAALVHLADPTFIVHPAVLDSALQLVAAALDASSGPLMVPAGFDQLVHNHAPGPNAKVYAQANRVKNQVEADVRIFDSEGLAIEVSGITFKRAGALADYGFHKLDWQHQTLTDGLLPPVGFAEAADLARLLIDHNIGQSEHYAISDYDDAEEALNKMATLYAIEALERLGMAFEPGTEGTLGALTESLGIVDKHKRLFKHLIGFLVEDGVLEQNGRRWKILKSPGRQQPDVDALTSAYPALAAEISVAARCGDALDSVLTDETNALTLLFPKEDTGAGDFYTGSTYANTINKMVGTAVKRLSNQLGPARALRIVEIGAGTGATTQCVLDVLEGRPVAYEFTDISPAFFSAATQNFAVEGFNTQRLNIEEDPLEQGFTADSADIVIAANVLHATADIVASLHHTRSLLAPGGMLILVESTKARRWVDTVFGLTEGWWRFKDTDLRPSHPLLSTDQWADVLKKCGFEPGVSDGVEVIVARKSAQPLEAADRIAISGGGSTRIVKALENLGIDVHSPGQENHHVYLVPPTSTDLESQIDLFDTLCEFIRTLESTPTPPRLTLVGRLDTGHGGLAGFMRSLQLEKPGLRSRLIQTDGEPADLLDEIMLRDGEEAIRYSQNQRFVARLAPVESELPANVEGTWLITGGHGGLGRAIASRLAESGAERLVLIGRSNCSDAPQYDIPTLYHEGDCADEAFLNKVFEDTGPINGVVHAAGLLSNASIDAQSKQTAAEVMHAKVGGAIALDNATCDRKITHFILFSSAAGVLGAASQSNHAFAGSFLDALAANRRARNLPALSIDWGVWRDIGSAAALGFDKHAEELGLGSIAPELGVRAFLSALNVDQPQLLVLPGVNFSKVASHFGSNTPSLFAQITRKPDVPLNQTGRRNIQSERNSVENNLIDDLGRIVAELLNIASPIDTTLPLYEYGLDSLVAVEIKNRAERELGLILQVRDMMEGGSIREILGKTSLPPQSDDRQRLYSIISELLGLTLEIDPQLPLYEYGLDSLVAVEIKNRVEKEMGIALQVRDMIEGGTAETLAQALQTVTPAPTNVRQQIVADPANDSERFPLTDIQQAYWLGRRNDMSFGNVSCYLYTEFDSDGIDIVRLEEAWNRLISRHGMLRVVIDSDGAQRILDDVPRYKFDITDLRETPPETSQDRLLQIRSAASSRIAIPDDWPLFDVRITLHENLTRVHVGFDLIALDAASIHALRVEWAALYDDLNTALPAIGLSFRDVVMESILHRSSDAFKRSEAYWLARADTLPEAPDLPMLDQGSSEPPRFVRHRIVLDPDLTHKLKMQCRQRKLTLPAVLAAAYADILASWSRNPHFALTVTSFNRPNLHPDIGSLLGDFTSTLLLEVDARKPQFEDRARMLASRLADDLDNSDIGGVHVLRELSKIRGNAVPNVPVVFTSALGFRSTGNEADQDKMSGWDRLGRTVYNVSSTPQVWIDHQVSEENGALFCNWDVLEALFPDGLIDAMVAAHEKLLTALANGPAWNWPLRAAIAPMQRAPVLPALSSELLHAPFMRMVQSTPDAVAVIDRHRTLTYRQLNHAACSLAEKISTLLGGSHTTRDQLIAINQDKGWQQVVGVLGTLMAGAAYLPLDPAWPEERQRQIIEQSGAYALDSDLIDEAMGTPETQHNLVPPADCDRLAYVIYTSGSTGTPKGVMIEHRSASATITAVNRKWNMGANDRTLALSSLSFDLSVFDIFGPLSVGGAIVIPYTSSQPNPQMWASVLQENEVTVWNSAPALMSLMVEHGLPTPNKLRLVMMSGDWVPLEIVPQLRDQAPNATLVALGGATEASIWSNFHEISGLDDSWHSVPYGTPLEGQNLHIVSRDFLDLPDWTIGDIEISGAGLARGYLGDEEQTAQRFRIDPGTGDRRYRTGDIGRFRPYVDDETSARTLIEFLGREDFQVKVQGHRIELGEIESVLEESEYVARAVVNAFSTGRGSEKILGGFIVPKTASVAPLPYDMAIQVAQATSDRLAVPVDTEAFDGNATFLTQQTADAVAAACQHLTGSHEQPDADTLINQFGVSERFRHWLNRTLPLIHRANTSDHQPHSIHQLPEQNPLGFGKAELDLLDTIIAKLPDILTEKIQTADIYLSAQTPNVYKSLFDTPYQIISDIIDAMAVDRPIRILEIGGGLGTTLAAIAGKFAGSKVCYTFTDISRAMLNRVRTGYDGADWLNVELLDIDVAPEAEAERYDIILATSTLHVASDVAVAIENTAKRLIPGGILIVLEQTRFFPWYDLNMGLQAGFDQRSDFNCRPEHALLSRDDWRLLLTKGGFARVDTPVSQGSLTDHLGFDVLLAQTALPTRDNLLDTDKLRDWLLRRLPAYMVPRSLNVIARLPLSANGKVDRAALQLSPQNSDSATLVDKDTLLGQVSDLVANCLGTSNVGPAQSLFELGATSLSLVSLQRQIGERFGRAIPLQSIFEEATVNNLVRMISSDAVVTNPIVRFAQRKTNDSRPVLIMMPGIFALPYYLRDLALNLENDIDLISVQLPGLFAGEGPLDTIDEQVRYVLAQIRQFQPKGPYLLGGYSYGGTVAYEVTRQLRQSGESVPLLLLVDTVRTRTGLEAFTGDDIAYTAMVRGLLAVYGEHIDFDDTALQDTPPKEVYHRLTVTLSEQGQFGPMGLPSERMAAIFKANFNALGNYNAQSLPGDLSLIRSEEGFPVEFQDHEPADSLEDPGLGWSELVEGDLEIRTIPGSHLTLLAPESLGTTADIIRDLVRKNRTCE